MKLILGAIVIVSIVVGGVWFYASNGLGKEVVGTTSVRCLSENEKATYEVLEKGRPGRVRINVVDVTTSGLVWSRELIMHDSEVANGVHVKECNFYIHQAFNYDYSNEQTLQNFSFHIWRFPYFEDSIGKSVVVTSDNQSDAVGQRRVYYGREFTIDPSENHASLERGQLGKPDYALVIKNVETGVDEFVLPLSEVLKDHPNAAGSFDVGAWVTRPDGTYLSTIIYDGSRWMAYIYVKLGTWETQIYETPSDYMAGVERSAPPFAPLLAYTDVIVWAGFDTVTDDLLEEQIASGQKKHLILADLETGGKTVLEEVPIERDHRFNFKWLSDTELQYTMPDGTIKTHHL